MAKQSTSRVTICNLTGTLVYQVILPIQNVSNTSTSILSLSLPSCTLLLLLGMIAFSANNHDSTPLWSMPRFSACLCLLYIAQTNVIQAHF